MAEQDSNTTSEPKEAKCSQPLDLPKPRRRRRWFFAGFAGVVLGGIGWNVYHVIWPPSSEEGDTDVKIVAFNPDGRAPAESDKPDRRRAADEHPLDPALRVAHNGLANIRENVVDYTASIVKRERIKGRLTEEETMFCKIRNRKEKDGKLITPLSVYLRFDKPATKKGREVIWVEGKNNGKLIGHGTGAIGFIRVSLDPTSTLAMLGNRYPITNIGIENLVVQMIDRGERERALGHCEVEFVENLELNGRKCTLVEVRHPEKKPQYDFFKGQIYIDDELNVPIRYAAYTWPEKEGDPPVLEEEYTYLDLKLNVGLTDKDFDPDNEDYVFP